MLDNLRGLFESQLSEPAGREARQVAVCLLLVACRSAPLVALCPWLLREVPIWVRASLLCVLDLALLPVAWGHAPHPLPEDVVSLSPMALRELVVGSVFAMCTAMPIVALGWVGRLTDVWRGALGGELSFAQSSPLQQFLLYAAGTLFIALGAHLWVLRALADALSELPVGGVATSGQLRDVARELGLLIASALRFAATLVVPVAVVLWVLDLALGVLGRVAEGLPAFFVAMPMRAAAGLLVVLLGLTFTLERLPEAFSASLELARDTLKML